MRTWINVWCAALSCMILDVATATAQNAATQPGPPIVHPEDFEQFLKQVVEVAPELPMLLEVLYEEYSLSHAAARQLADRELEASRLALLQYRTNHGNRPGYYTPEGDDFGRSNIILQWDATQFQLALDFESDVAALLPPDLMDDWAHHLQLTHAVQRRRWLDPRHQIPGLNNLLDAIDDIDISSDDEERIEPIRELYFLEYCRALEAAVVQQRLLLPEAFELEARIAVSAPETEDKAIELSSAFRSSVRQVEEVNERFLQQFKQLLEPVAAEEFERAVRIHHVPEFYQRTPTDRIIELMRTVTSLTSAQRDEIEAVYETYTLERQWHRKRLIRASLEWSKPSVSRQRHQQYGELLRLQRDGHDVDPEIAKAGHPGMESIQQLLRLEERTCRRLKQMFATLPAESIPHEIRFLSQWPDLADDR
ncbi:MAG: hypothetical protein ACR2GY_06205 [Phycisphaerales bacterium]